MVNGEGEGGAHVQMGVHTRVWREAFGVVKVGMYDTGLHCHDIWFSRRGGDAASMYGFRQRANDVN